MKKSLSDSKIVWTISGSVIFVVTPLTVEEVGNLYLKLIFAPLRTSKPAYAAVPALTLHVSKQSTNLSHKYDLPLISTE